MYYTEFQVSGRGRIPFDMLRHDCVFPANTETVSVLSKDLDFDAESTLILGKFHSHKTNGQLTNARWQSFGWSVDSETIPRKLLS